MSHKKVIGGLIKHMETNGLVYLTKSMLESIVENKTYNYKFDEVGMNLHTLLNNQRERDARADRFVASLVKSKQKGEKENESRIKE